MNEWSKEILDWCERKGWNKDLVLEKSLMNCHSELSEAWEEIRSGHGVTEIYESEGGKPEGFPVELVDTIIRLLHLCAYYKFDVDELVAYKMAYNEKRPYRHGGKTC